MSLHPVTVRNAVDAFTNQLYPSANYADTPNLRLRTATNLNDYGYIYFSRPFPLGATVLSATLRVYSDAHAGSWAAASRTMTVARTKKAWKVAQLNYNNQPAVEAADQVQVTKTAAVTDGTVWSFDVTAHLQAVADGAGWYGWRLDLNDATLRYLYSAQGTRSAWKPALDVTWASKPSKPTTLSPAGGRSVSKQTPTLRFDFAAGNAALQALQLQVNAADTWTGTLTLDSGTILSSLPQIDLATLTAALAVNGDFDTNTTGWTAGANTTLARVTTPVSTGAGAASLTSVAAGDISVNSASGTAGVPVTAGETYTLSAMVRTAVTGRATRTDLDWYTTTGGLVSTVNGTATTSTTTYALRSVTAVAPATAAFARLRVTVVATAAASEVHYVDAVAFELGSNTTFDGWVDGQLLYWRVRVQDVSGLWSDWSDVASATRNTKGTLTISNPAAATPIVQEATPPILWTFTGRTQAAFVVLVTNAAGAIIHNSGKQTSTDTTYTLPKGVIRNTQSYTVWVRVWDTIDREATPGDSAYVQATCAFTYTLSATVTVVAALTATDLAPAPAVQLDWTRTTAPDSWTVVRDGDVLDAQIPVGELLVTGTAYRYIDRTAAPRVPHTWEVRPVVNGVTAATNPTVTKTIAPVGIWLVDPGSGLAVQLLGQDEGSWDMGEQASNFEVLGSSRIVRITQGLRGYEGTVTGVIAAYAGRTLDQIEADLWTLKSQPGGAVRLVAANLNLPVIIGKVVPSPTPAPDLNKKVTVDFWQQGELPFAVTL